MLRPASLCVLILASVLGCSQTDVIAPDDPGALPVHTLRLPDGLNIAAARVVRGSENTRLILVDIVNTTPDTIRFTRGVCFSRLRAFRGPELAEPAVWDDHRKGIWACPDVGVSQRLLPMGTLTLSEEVDTEEYATWPPPISSYLGVVLVNNGIRVVLPAGNGWR